MMVLCAAASCGHRNCHGGPFLLVFVCNQGNSVHGCVYSSKAGAWGTPVSVNIGNGGYYVSANSAGHAKRGALVRDNAYFALRKIAFRGHEEFTTHNANPNKILKYDLGKNFLSVIDVEPALDTCIRDAFVMPMEDGSLGFAGIRDSGLYMWRRTVRRWGDARWVPCRVVDHEKLLPSNISCNQATVVGFAEGVGVAFVIINNSSIFMIELKSEQIRKVTELGLLYTVLPFMSFYTPAGTVRGHHHIFSLSLCLYLRYVDIWFNGNKRYL